MASQGGALVRIASQKSEYKLIWLLSWPVMLSNISQPLLGLVDIAVIGHLPDSRFLAAVAIGTTIFSFVYWSFGFLRMGTTGMIAQLVGAQDGSANRTVLAQSIVLALLIALTLLLLQQPIIETALLLLAPDQQVLPQAQVYAEIRIFGAPAVLCNYVLLGWFVGNQNTKVLLILLVSTNLLNIVLDVLAGNVLGMRAEGLAYATVISEYFGLAVACWYCRKMLRKVSGAIVYSALTQLQQYYPIIKVNRYLFVRTILLLLAMSFFTAQGAKLGADTLAANAVLMTFVMLISHVLDGFAHALEALTGKAIGAGNLGKFYQLVSAAAVCSLGVALFFSILFYLLGDFFIHALTSIVAVREIASDYLPWLVAMPLIAVTSYLLDGVFIGATQVQLMQNAMLISVALVYFPVWYFTQGWLNHGLWIALLSLYAGRGVTSCIGFYRLSKSQRWLAKTA
ncbi:MAG: MATE family efflux transporter [Pseudomonadales bacterium]|nr:MATE family efflux transporter [Pseudomonadales bacterium]